MRHASPAPGTPAIAALDRSLALLGAILADGEGRSLPDIAAALGLPRATAHRQVATLQRAGFLARLGNGALVAGPRLRALAPQLEPVALLVAAARPVLARLAARLGCVAQLGTLDGDMLTYRLKVGARAGAVFTRVSEQLEAYCTGLGKVMLAHLPARAREAYLATGPFPALTANTITDPAVLRAALAAVREQGYAVDAQEIADELTCFAVPLWRQGAVVAAISVSFEGTPPDAARARTIIAALRAAAAAIAAGLEGVD